MNLNEYIGLIEEFLANRITASDFETQFLKMFSIEPADMDKKLFLILDGLFGAIESYWPEYKESEANQFDISESTLRKEAEQALNLLIEFKETLDSET